MSPGRLEEEAPAASARKRFVRVCHARMPRAERSRARANGAVVGVSGGRASRDPGVGGRRAGRVGLVRRAVGCRATTRFPRALAFLGTRENGRRSEILGRKRAPRADRGTVSTRGFLARSAFRRDCAIRQSRAFDRFSVLARNREIRWTSGKTLSIFSPKDERLRDRLPSCSIRSARQRDGARGQSRATAKRRRALRVPRCPPHGREPAGSAVSPPARLREARPAHSRRSGRRGGFRGGRGVQGVGAQEGGPGR